MTKEWIRQRKRDPFYRKAKTEGYRSRSAYKLKEINNRLRLIRKGSAVIDVGAAPGGWSQVASEIVGERGTVVAVDIIPMESMGSVRFVQGDIEDPGTVERIMDIRPLFDAVISDASPSLSGNRTLDRGRSLALNWAVLKMALQVLKPGGGVVVKMFQGSEVDELMEEYGPHFNNVDRIKPKSSLKKSIELFIGFRGFKGNPTEDGEGIP
ncbi:MAG: RlmE family RNA methyltransferase [Thermoplasmatota archaeon]